MYIAPSVNCKCSAEEEQGLGRLAVDKLKCPMAFFTPKAVTGKNTSESPTGYIVGSCSSPGARVMCFSPQTITHEHSLGVEMSLPSTGEVHLLLVKLISLSSFVTSKSLTLVLSLGNKNQWEFFLKGRVYVAVLLVLLKSKKSQWSVFICVIPAISQFPTGLLSPVLLLVLTCLS